jgi:hypothetical protein
MAAKRKREAKHHQKPYISPERVPLVVMLPPKRAEALQQWADDENRSLSSLLAELLEPLFTYMEARGKRGKR